MDHAPISTVGQATFKSKRLNSNRATASEQREQQHDAVEVSNKKEVMVYLSFLDKVGVHLQQTLRCCKPKNQGYG